MAEVSEKKLISIENTAKLITLVLGFYTVLYNLKMDNERLRSEVLTAISDYKNADKILDLRLSACEKRDDNQDKNIRIVTDKLIGLIPEKVKMKNDEDQ